MKKFKLMFKSLYSMDAIYELRKMPIILSLIFGLVLSMMQMTPFGFSLMKDETYRWDEKIWTLTDEEKVKLVESLPDYSIVDGHLTGSDYYEIKVNSDVSILFNGDANSINNGLVFNQDHLVFVEQGRQYQLSYVLFNGDANSINNGLVFNQDHLVFVEQGRQYQLSYVAYEGTNFATANYDDVFAPFAVGLKPHLMAPFLLANYQSGILTFLIYSFVVAAISMLLKFGHTTFLKFKEVLNIVIYSATIPSVIALVFGMLITPAFTTLIFNFGTPIVAYVVYKNKVIPNLM